MALSEKARQFSIDALLSSLKTPEINCELANPELWSQFSCIGTEMIITKAGRRMFPPLQVVFNGDGIDDDKNYLIVFEIVQTSDKRFRYSYNKSSWTTIDDEPAGNKVSDAELRAMKSNGNGYSKKANVAADVFVKRNKVFIHPEAPIRGCILKNNKILSFERIKLTNNADLDRFSDHVSSFLFSLDECKNCLFLSIRLC